MTIVGTVGDKKRGDPFRLTSVQPCQNIHTAFVFIFFFSNFSFHFFMKKKKRKNNVSLPPEQAKIVIHSLASSIQREGEKWG